jgi:hypothetical protein
MERPDFRLREPVGVKVGQSAFDQPPPPSGAEWLTEFLRREGLIEYPRLAGRDLPGQEPARPSYGTRRGMARALTVGCGVLLAAGLVAGAVAYHDAMRGPPARPLPPPAAASPVAAPPAVAPPITAHPPRRPASSPSVDFPRQPVHAPPLVLGDWVAVPVPPKAPAVMPAVVAPAPKAPIAPAPKALIAPTPKVPTAAAPRRDGLNLRIVHPPSGPAEASRIDALVGGLRREIGDIASATVTLGPASPEILVLYFFPADHANARRIAASLGRATRQSYQVKQGHADPLPSPGTVEIRLP